MKNKYHLFLLIAVLLVWIWSGIDVKDTYLTWFLETVPFLIVLPILIFTYKRFPLSNLTYTLIAIHSILLMIGGHYSYAKVPIMAWFDNLFGITRNNYDKVGHFMQGFGPAIYAREILMRTSPLKGGKWLAFMAVAVPLAFSAIYEIFEWLASLTNPTETEAFLGTQGYVYDTQTDMLFCLIGSIVAILLLTKIHDKSMKKLLTK